jgi:putative SOS response-associated peptidase YedK
MCGRFALTHSTQELADLFAIEEVLAPLTPRYNVAPTQPVAAVIERERRTLEWLQWGLVPSWAPGPEGAARMINARAETLATRSAFREALRRRRCLVPASGFYEWHGEAKRRQPIYFSAADGRPLGLAGLWETWVPEQGEPLRTCTIVTVPANPTVARYHERMPAVLAADDIAAWLSADPKPTASLLALLRPWGGTELEARAVSPRVNRASYDAADCIQSLPAEGPPPRLF